MLYCIAGLNDSPIALCEQNGLTVILRILLALRPELSPSSLEKLNWDARRVAVLMSMPPPALKRAIKDEKCSGMKAFTTASSSTLLPASNIVTNSLTDDLNIMSEGVAPIPHSTLVSVPSVSEGVSAHRQRRSEYDDDIEWLLSDRQCASLQSFMVDMYNNEPKLWRKIVMYL